jgi:hypothetical protein
MEGSYKLKNTLLSEPISYPKSVVSLTIIGRGILNRVGHSSIVGLNAKEACNKLNNIIDYKEQN